MTKERTGEGKWPWNLREMLAVVPQPCSSLSGTARNQAEEEISTNKSTKWTNWEIKYSCGSVANKHTSVSALLSPGQNGSQLPAFQQAIDRAAAGYRICGPVRPACGSLIFSPSVAARGWKPDELAQDYRSAPHLSSSSFSSLPSCHGNPTAAAAAATALFTWPIYFPFQYLSLPPAALTLAWYWQSTQQL